MMWQADIETMPRAQLEQLQLKRLQDTVARLRANSALYGERLKEVGEVKHLQDIEKIPFTVKDDFRNHYPTGLLAVDKREVVRYQGSSGTTGKPTIAGYTKKDLEIWADLVARVACAAGVTPEDTAQVCFGYGLFTGGFGLHYGLERLGAAVLPMSSGNTERQLMMMEDFGITVLIATPSYAQYLGEMAREAGVAGKLKLRVGLFGGEGCTAAMRQRIEQNLGIVATDNYGMCELTGPGISGECLERNGLHFAEDCFYVEVIDPDTGAVLPRGEQGELVVTTLMRDAQPVLRYRTRDITRLHYEQCACGRTHVRMEKVKGRSDDMLIIKGVNVFPSQIEGVLMGFDHIGAHYQLVLKTVGFIDTMEINVELLDGALLESFGELENLQRSLEARLHAVLGLSAKVKLVGPRTLERFTGKAKRVLDLRSTT